MQGSRKGPGLGRGETRREGHKRAPAGRSRREWEGVRKEEQVGEETQLAQRTEREVQKEEGKTEKRVRRRRRRGGQWKGTNNREPERSRKRWKRYANKRRGNNYRGGDEEVTRKGIEGMVKR